MKKILSLAAATSLFSAFALAQSGPVTGRGTELGSSMGPGSEAAYGAGSSSSTPPGSSTTTTKRKSSETSTKKSHGTSAPSDQQRMEDKSMLKTEPVSDMGTGASSSSSSTEDTSSTTTTPSSSR